MNYCLACKSSPCKCVVEFTKEQEQHLEKCVDAQKQTLLNPNILKEVN